MATQQPGRADPPGTLTPTLWILLEDFGDELRSLCQRERLDRDRQLTIENHIERVALFGDVTLTRDKKRLQLALSVQSVLNRTVEALQREPLPDVFATVAPQRKPNPF